MRTRVPPRAAKTTLCRVARARRSDVPQQPPCRAVRRRAPAPMASAFVDSNSRKHTGRKTQRTGPQPSEKVGPDDDVRVGVQAATLRPVDPKPNTRGAGSRLSLRGYRQACKTALRPDVSTGARRDRCPPSASSTRYERGVVTPPLHGDVPVEESGRFPLIGRADSYPLMASNASTRPPRSGRRRSQPGLERFRA